MFRHVFNSFPYKLPSGRLLACAAILLFGFASSQVADAGMIYVNYRYAGASDGSSTRPFRTLSEAHAAAAPGDTVQIQLGHYPDSGRYSKQLRVESSGGRAVIGRTLPAGFAARLSLPGDAAASVPFAVVTTSTNVLVDVNLATTGIVWYEVRWGSPSGAMLDFGAHAASSPWSFTVRHLREGANYVFVFAKSASSGEIVSSQVVLTMDFGANPPVRTRPHPAEIWWGGLSDNTQMTNYSQWTFVQKFQDGYFFHSYGWNPTLTAWLQSSLAANLRASNTRFWCEPGGDISNPTTGSGTAQADFWGNWWAAACQANGIIWSEFTHDYHMENMQAVCAAHPSWPPNDQIAWWTGDLGIKSASYPYTTGIWRDAFNGYYTTFPHIKVGHTSQPEYWPWDAYPALVANSLSFTLSNGTRFSFDAHDIFASFVNMSAAIGHPYFALSSDAPWDYFGAWNNAAAAATMRKKIRVYETYLQSRSARHTLICNVSNAETKPGGNDAQDIYYEQSSFSNMTLHQAEGGRADRYLFESWYLGIPHSVVPETKAGSYCHLALSAIKYLKGIRDLAGSLEPLSLSVVNPGALTTVRLRNDGDVACMPAIMAFETGSSKLTTRYLDSAGIDITARVLSAEGYVHTNKLQPGALATFTVRTDTAGAPAGASKTISLEAFWNPQDPTGIVRDRKSYVVTAN
jgi:hypothetical protein